ncbi:unnamed protein product [Gordionus sp. m RMFG-2023]|uniref:uncharacterized protein LOC135924568 n=1 Tax=Gordionus sp. m RMFG-2023 TaxID=3053472 RepID=UPI0030E22CCF
MLMLFSIVFMIFAKASSHFNQKNDDLSRYAEDIISRQKSHLYKRDTRENEFNDVLGNPNYYDSIYDAPPYVFEPNYDMPSEKENNEIYKQRDVIMDPSKWLNVKRAASALKWTGLGKRNFLQFEPRSSSNLRWIGLGKRFDSYDDEFPFYSASMDKPQSRSTLFKWTGLGRKKRLQPYNYGNFYDPRNLRSSMQYKWTGLGKRSPRMNYNRLYSSSYNSFLPDNAQNDFSAVEGILKFRNLSKIDNLYRYDAKDDATNKYINNNNYPFYKFHDSSGLKRIQTKKLNPIYQWRGLGN